MSDIKTIEAFLGNVELIVRKLWRERMQYEPYARPGDYYPEAFAEVLSEMEKASETRGNGGLENTEECVPGLQGST